MTTAGNLCDVSVMNDLRFLWLEITAKCNLLCVHCYAESGPHGELYGNMTYEDWTRVINEAAELGCRTIQFIGGEPTMHPRLSDLVDHANHRRFAFIEVFTNATRLGQKLVGCFQRNRVHVATSFYSDDPAIHEQITRGEGSWPRTVHGIEKAVAAGLPLRVGVIETERNAGHAPRAIEFLKTLGVNEFRVDRQRGVGRGDLVQLGGNEERYEELCGQCWRGRLCVTPGGDTFPCVFSRATRLGDVRCGLAGILQTAKLAAFRHRVRALHAHAPDDCQPYPCPPEGPCDPHGGCPPTTCTPNCSPPCAPDANCQPY
jgi:MoaA/NifB/PqqE/SkfB family radical SAM enzyme